jgi:lipopolysaccharide biosynthesis glycosyltransferase
MEKVTILFACYNFIPTFAAVLKKKQDDSELYIYSAVWHYYSAK